MKGISISIETLVALAVALIVLLASVAWLMGALGPTASQEKLKQNFDNLCIRWTVKNCAPKGDIDNVPDEICTAYNDLMKTTGNCNHEVVAQACGCTPPYGTGMP